MAKILKFGSKGEGVRELQTLLVKADADPKIRVDGDFGGQTESAVRNFQGKAGLLIDGKAGPQTLTALRQYTTPAKTPTRAEPDKTAISKPIVGAPAKVTKGAPPPNVATLKLLETNRPISEIIWHCAATREGQNFTVDDIRAWHKLRGFSDVGYHYIVYRDGRIMLGRPVGQIGAHVEGHNTGTIGCCYIGGLTADGKNPKDTRTPAQVASMLWLTEQLARIHKGVKKVSGHNQYSSKACPSFYVPNDPLGKLLAA